MAGQDYQKKLLASGNELVIEASQNYKTAYYNGVKVAEIAEPCSSMRQLMFSVIENNQHVTYDITIIDTAGIHCFVGRNGNLIFSDAPGFETNPEEIAGKKGWLNV